MALKQKKLTDGELTNIAAADYLRCMFQDGKNRLASITKGNDKAAYDKAAHTIDPDLTDFANSDIGGDFIDTTLHSRDGTEASGELDMDGGSLGGTEKELDDLEATGMPVDRIPHMKD